MMIWAPFGILDDDEPNKENKENEEERSYSMIICSKCGNLKYDKPPKKGSFVCSFCKEWEKENLSLLTNLKSG